AVDLLAEHGFLAANAYPALGTARAAAGDIDAADTAYDRAVSGLSERGQWREAIKVARDWAEGLRAAGRDERAYVVLERATEITQQLGAPAGASRRTNTTPPVI